MEVLLVLTPLLLVALAFVAYCLIDLAKNEEVRGLPRWAWAVAIIFFVPLGGIGYLLFGRPR